MEDNNQIDYELKFVSLFNNKQKFAQVNFKAIIKEINSETEQMTFAIQSLEKKKTFYKGLYAIKGEIFPIPKINDNVQIIEVVYKLDADFNPGFFIKLKKTEDINLISFQENNNLMDLTKDNIITTLKDLLNITRPLYSKTFLIIDDSMNDYYILKCLENNLDYYLIKNPSFLEYSFHKKDIIYVSNYYEDIGNNRNIIGLTLITLVEKLTEENLFFLLEKNYINQNKYLLTKVVEIINYNKKKEIILLGENKKLFSLMTNDENIKLGQICLFVNYGLSKIENTIPIIEKNNESFSYFSSQEIYFSNKIKLNNFSVIQFYFLDFIYGINGNLFTAIKINEERRDITSKEMNIIIETKKIKNYEYYPISIQLIEKDNKNITFNFNLLHGLLNKINGFINKKNKNPYFYEYLYYYCDSMIYQAKKNIILDGKSYSILLYDNFDSSNRLRFNVLNIPFQKECNEKLLKKSNSLMVYEIFTEEKLHPENIGVFCIDEIKNNIPNLKSNNIFDKYYNDFGFIYNALSDFKNQKPEDLVDICTKNFIDKITSDKKIDFKNISCYEEEISLSQFKTRIGIIVSYYLSISSKNEKIDVLEKIQNIFKIIYRRKNSLSLMQFLRLFKFLVKKLLINYQVYKPCFISEMDEFSPYLAAYNFNVEEINNIEESSRLFMAYLQIDSYILVNHYKYNAKSYSLSIEPLFMVRNHLLQTYEGFFLIEKSDQNRYAQSITDEKITIINIKKIFEFSNIINFEDMDRITEPDILKNHAFAVSMEFRHENNSHQKKNQKNRHITSPIYYFDKAEIKKIEYLKNNKIQGEDGRLIEAFIDDDRERISSLQADIIYGNLLDIKLFIQSNFDELKKKFNEIITKKDKFNDKKKIKEDKDEIKEDKDEIKEDKDEIKEDKNEIKDDFNQKNKNEKEFEERYMELKRTGTIMISDEEYTDYLIKEIIKKAKNNDTYDELPEIIIYIDKRLEKEEKN